MAPAFRPRAFLLFLGDLFFFISSLWLSLAARGLALPSQAVLIQHLAAFSILFVAWVGIFFIVGLYENRSIILGRRALSATLLVAQTANLLIAALFFFFVPFFGIEPKTLLFIYLAISFPLILFWRGFLFPLLGLQKPENALVVGAGVEIDELLAALRSAPRAPARVVAVVAPSSASLLHDVQKAIHTYQPRFVITDFADPLVAAAFPELYNLLLRGVRFFDSAALYEEVFGRVPLSRVNQAWIARYISRSAHTLYDPLKRAIDIFVSVLLGAVSLLLYPFIIAAIKLDTEGPAIIAMPRVGEGGVVFNFYKFRSMSGNDAGNYGAEGVSKLNVTPVGKFLRRTRLDELPQFWNVLRGDLSLVGPRPEFPALVATYEREIPFYSIRHLIRPGLSGSAQLYYHGDPHHAADVESTKMKLSYDLFYLKHRSLTLDLSIGLKTIRRIVMRSNA